MCSGLKGGMEGAVHGMCKWFELKSSDGFGMLLVDAKNAFNTISREAALLNVRVVWPLCSRFPFNIYQGYSSLWIDGTGKSSQWLNILPLAKNYFDMSPVEFHDGLALSYH